MFESNYFESSLVDSITFRNNTPFHHIVLDNFVQGPLTNVVHEIQSVPNDKYDFNEHHQVQIKKRGLSSLDSMPQLTRTLVQFFQSDRMTHYLSQLTGIQGLRADPSLLGGGIHKTDSGGHLSIHADFNIHPVTGMHRRINLLLFLNPEWVDSWGGHLELWDSLMTACEKSIAPILNRVVIFRITDDAFHGHPDPLQTPDNISRYSLAFYYYTEDRPEDEKRPFHWAAWQQRPGGNF